jgi:hypothetical protein
MSTTRRFMSSHHYLLFVLLTMTAECSWNVAEAVSSNSYFVRHSWTACLEQGSKQAGQPQWTALALMTAFIFAPPASALEDSYLHFHMERMTSLGLFARQSGRRRPSHHQLPSLSILVTAAAFSGLPSTFSPKLLILYWTVPGIASSQVCFLSTKDSHSGTLSLHGSSATCSLSFGVLENRTHGNLGYRPSLSTSLPAYSGVWLNIGLDSNHRVSIGFSQMVLHSVPSTCPAKVPVDRRAAQSVRVGECLDAFLAVGKLDFFLFYYEVDARWKGCFSICGIGLREVMPAL